MKKLSVLWAMLLLPAASLAQVGGPGTVVVGGGGSGGSGDVTGPSSSTDNAFVRFDSTTGKIIQTSNLTCSDVSGVTTTIATITPAATTGATVAGQALAITASPAVASTDTAGAAAGGSVTITAGAAARNASGNANGGDINLVTGAGIGTGTAGQVVAPVGSAASPSITFTGDTDTGIYRKVGDKIGVSTAGSEIAYFTTEGLALNGKIVSTVGGTINGFQRYTTQSTAGSGAPFALDVAYSFTVLTNEGSTAENYYTLPAASAGYQYTFIVQDTDGIRITATAGDTIRPIAGTAASATGGFIRCATAGAFITLVSINGTEWIAIGSAGVWTIDV